jgi:hypothetical protein
MGFLEKAVWGDYLNLKLSGILQFYIIVIIRRAQAQLKRLIANWKISSTLIAEETMLFLR